MNICNSSACGVKERKNTENKLQKTPLNFEQANMLKTLTFTGKKYLSDLIDLADKGIINRRITDLYLLRGRLNEDAKADLDKLKECYKNNKVISQEFVKNYKNEEDAEKKAKTGEVCQIGNDKYVSIKTETGYIIPLSLSKKKYLELFPPIERFSVIQNNIGDCWLLAACDALYSNPITRPRFLSVFRENESGGVDINFSSFEIKNGKSVPNNSKEMTYKSVDKSTGIRAILPKGFACVEEAIEKRRAQFGHDRIQDIYNYLNSDDQNMPFVYIDGVLFLDDDIKKFKEDVRGLLGHPEELAQSFIDPAAKKFYIGLNKKSTKKCLRQLERRPARKKFNNEEISLMKKVLNAHLLDISPETVNITRVKDIIPTETFLRLQKFDFKRKTLKENMNDALTSPYIVSGDGEAVFKLFGLFAKTIKAKDAKDELEYVTGDYLMTGSISKKSAHGAGFKLYKNHEYSIKVLGEKNGKKFFGVKNPHNASQEIVMDLNELSRTFDYITYAHPW